MRDIKDYAIEVANTSLELRIKLKKLLTSLNEPIYINTMIFTDIDCNSTYMTKSEGTGNWSGSNSGNKPILTIKQALRMFTKSKIKFTI